MSRLILPAVGGDPVLEKDYDLTLGDDDVRVAIDAAPINPADQLFMLGWFGVYPKVPNQLGAEGTGRVVAAGSQADRSLVGRRVIVLPTFVHGTWASEVVVPAAKVVAVPDADPIQLAMLAVNPATAYALLHDYVTLRPGDWVGLTVANSGVGQNLIALAKRAGLKVLAVVRSESAAARVHADIVLVDGDDLAARIGETKLRVIYDGGAPDLSKLLPALENGGTVVSFSAVTGESQTIPYPDLFYRDVRQRGFYIIRWVEQTPRAELVRVYTELASLVADGTLKVDVEATYPLSAYREALQDAGKDGRTGKVLFTPQA
ncbi:zinc-binding dehydrogenase [Actinoplanes sp. TBRC 11911]|uniref:alcohol dehydrogenase catalytic domain-containing protein n=1 Tax=Actinoplanes sp. TBRC 11911 TaxID=2729386 RepID=UPI00145E36B7|nr:zinc-binding dehydrogenase [Actinoplanes sp. TBRC 11911]NMO56606.1 zinc-binding dehydrogenase [Actinoplanes sp. TBRC 11911]